MVLLIKMPSGFSVKIKVSVASWFQLTHLTFTLFRTWELENNIIIIYVLMPIGYSMQVLMMMHVHSNKLLCSLYYISFGWMIVSKHLDKFYPASNKDSSPRFPELFLLYQSCIACIWYWDTLLCVGLGKP